MEVAYGAGDQWDIDLKADRAALSAGGQHSDLPERYFMEGETRCRPLKGRGSRVRRTVPIPSPLVPWFAEHVERYVDPSPDALVFTTARGANGSTRATFTATCGRQRARSFPQGSLLPDVRRHDLRHSAITAWLNNGVLLKT